MVSGRTSTPGSCSAFDAKVALACEVARLRCIGRYPLVTLWDGQVEELALAAGKKAALEGIDLKSPLVDLADTGCAGVRRIYELAYWEHTPAIDAGLYFDLAVDGPWVRITSKGVAKGDGEVTLHRSFVRNFFSRAADWSVASYESWALNPYLVGGTTALYRYDLIDDDDSMIDYDWDGHPLGVAGHVPPEPHPFEGMLVIDPDTHPSHGRIAFGDPSQELVQLGALLQLRATVRQLFATNTPSAEDRAGAAARAAEIRQRVQICFMPSSGYCGWCQADVTSVLSGRGAHDAVTGCPCCAHTWCD